MRGNSNGFFLAISSCFHFCFSLSHLDIYGTTKRQGLKYINEHSFIIRTTKIFELLYLLFISSCVLL